eukprot:11676824-Ditylum_brightwellii.AAC.1
MECIMKQAGEVPVDLIPYMTSKLTIKWEKETYRYYGLFDDLVVDFCYESEDGLFTWIRKAAGISEYLKTKCMGIACNQCTTLANTAFSNLFNEKIRSFNDVLKMFAQKDWYATHNHDKMQCIY